MAMFDLFSKKDKTVTEKVDKFVFEKNMTNSSQANFKSLVSNSNSKYIKNIENKLGVPHPFDFKMMGEINSRFGVVNAITDKIIDFAIGPGISIKCEVPEAKKILDNFISDHQLMSLIRPWTKEAVVKGNGFIEIAGLNQEGKSIALKNVNANNVYVKRDSKGKIIGFNQFIGGSYSRINDDEIIEFLPNELMHLSLNRMPGDAYGYGKVYPAEQIIRHFLVTQKALHFLVKRKANNPVHVKMGNVEKNDYPTQPQINSMAKEVTVLNEKTEFVTGPNVEIKSIDFGNFHEKFQDVLANDYKLVATAFQVPEVLLGAGNVPEGLAKVQMDAFERMIKSIQDEIEKVLEEQLLKKVLVKNKVAARFEIEWGEQNLNDKLNIVAKLNEIIKNPMTTDILRISLEKQIAEILELDIEKEIELEQEAKQKEKEEFRKQLAKQGMSPKDKVEKEKEEDEKLPKVPGQDSNECLKGLYKGILNDHFHESRMNEDVSIQEWVDFNLEELKQSIKKAIEIDDFTDLKALTKTEISAGYLNKRGIQQLKEILKKGFTLNMSIKQIEKLLLSENIIGDLYEFKGDKVNKEKILIDKKRRANIVARTETVRLANIGAVDTYKGKNVEKIRWVAALTDRTCPQCNALNGVVMESTNPQVLPPVHPMCRCTTTPVVNL